MYLIHHNIFFTSKFSVKMLSKGFAQLTGITGDFTSRGFASDLLKL